ncbi:MAG: MucD protein [Pirellulaceae bacterium]|nr:MAG: MucD protein [Pirellulaceae bacterium]
MKNMFRRKPVVCSLAIMLLVSAVGSVVIALPSTVHKLTYAVESAQSAVAKEELETANDLSAAFKNVAKALRPSVVSINSTIKVASSPRLPGGQPEIPEEFRRFFGDDFFDRFHFDLPQPPRGFEQHGTGSGFIISEDGYIVTNNHVVADADRVTVRLSDGREFRAKVIGTDPATDVAVLKIDADNLVPVTFGDSSKMEVGDWVVAIGSPLGLEQTVTTGIVSAIGRANVGITDYEDFLQTDAAINPGNSGGPLVNLKGEVIGMNTAIASRTGGFMGIGFAIPSNMVRRIAESLIENGSVERGWLGAVIQDLNQDLADSFGYDSTEGVLLSDVVEDSPADQAGLQSGDIIVRYDGQPVRDSQELRRKVAGTKPGSRVEVEYFRNGRVRTTTVKIGLLEPEKLASAGITVPRGRANKVEAPDLGIEVESLTEEMADELGIDQQEGAVVTKVEPATPASRAGLREGDVVVNVNGQPIGNAADFRKALEEVDLSKGVRMQVVTNGVRRFVFLKTSE